MGLNDRQIDGGGDMEQTPRTRIWGAMLVFGTIAVMVFFLVNSGA